MQKGASIGTCRMPTQYLSSTNRDTKGEIFVLLEFHTILK